MAQPPPALFLLSKFARYSLLLLLPVLPACSRISTTYLIGPDTPLERKSGAALFHDSLYYASPEANQMVDRDLVVRVGDLRKTVQSGTKFSAKRNMQAFGADFEAVISDELWRTGIFHDVAPIRDEDPIPKPNLELYVAITEWKEGSGILRWILTLAGRTRVQVEGQFADPQTGKILAAFADARIHPGHGHLSTKTFRPQTLIAEDLSEFVTDLCRQVLAMTGTADPGGNKYGPAPRVRPVRAAAQASAQSAEPAPARLGGPSAKLSNDVK